MKVIDILYLGGSGFFFRSGGTGLLFDACGRGTDARIVPEKESIDALDSLYVFVTHHHAGHFSPEIYELCGEKAHFILSNDLPEQYAGEHMSPGDQFEFPDLKIQAFRSTDEGVSYLVEWDGVTLFHAGDLNLWHWRDISTIVEIEQAERDFEDCIREIPRDVIDIACFPVDPRQGSMYDAGAGSFVMTVRPHLLLPMHFQGRADAARHFAIHNETNHTRIEVLERAGDSMSLTFGSPDDEPEEPQEPESPDNPVDPVNSVDPSDSSVGADENPEDAEDISSNSLPAEQLPEDAEAPFT